MQLKKFIKTTIDKYLNEHQILKENVQLIDNILDKINKVGQNNLSYDERNYLKQYNDKTINKDLENWLLSDDENTFDNMGNKLLFDEFEDDEDLFYNREKLKRILSKHLNKKPFTNNSDWGGAYVWNVNTNNNNVGVFFYLGDDELVLLKRKINGDEYEDETIKTITNPKELYNSLLWVGKDKTKKNVNITIDKYLNENQILKEYNKYDSFLSNYETAKKYAHDNIDDVAEAFDAYDEDPNDIHASYSRDKYIELIELYVDKYNELKTQNSVTIYRLIMLNSINDLDVNNIGKHWSFEENGVGAYGEQHPNRGMMKTGKSFVLEADVNPKYIDWIYGFSSFIWYGEDQWECALIKGAKVVINSINKKELKQPINAIVGDY